MTPNFDDNDLIIITKFFFNLEVGDLVILDIPELGTVLKRISFIEDNSIKVKGDNEDYDSLIYNNSYNKDNVVGKVLFKFS
jgi:phage repressor protein C with HTH and peptisase S24 domain|tara:strand:- start:2319 stop:2561 length:243 start_codon:yes stop_codon:yes gene_type:complete